MGYRAAAGNGQEEEKMIQTPNTYSDWTKVLDIFKSKQNDEDVLQAMQQGALEWQSGVAERFSKRLVDSVNARMNAASDKFQRDMSNARGGEGAIVQALLGLRREMAFLVKAVDIPALPEEYRKQYVQLVIDQADKMQSSLEDTAKKDRSGKMSSVVRNHKVNAF